MAAAHGRVKDATACARMEPDTPGLWLEPTGCRDMALRLRSITAQPGGRDGSNRTEPPMGMGSTALLGAWMMPPLSQARGEKGFSVSSRPAPCPWGWIWSSGSLVPINLPAPSSASSLRDGAGTAPPAGSCGIHRRDPRGMGEEHTGAGAPMGQCHGWGRVCSYKSPLGAMRKSEGTGSAPRQAGGSIFTLTGCVWQEEQALVQTWSRGPPTPPPVPGRKRGHQPRWALALPWLVFGGEQTGFNLWKVKEDQKEPQGMPRPLCRHGGGGHSTRWGPKCKVQRQRFEC